MATLRPAYQIVDTNDGGVITTAKWRDFSKSGSELEGEPRALAYITSQLQQWARHAHERGWSLAIKEAKV